MLKEHTGLRNRGGLDSLDAGRGKLTPTPRRSIHSFRVSEHSRQVVGRETRERIEMRGGVSSESSGGNCVQYFFTLLKVAMFLAMLYYLYYLAFN